MPSQKPALGGMSLAVNCSHIGKFLIIMAIIGVRFSEWAQGKEMTNMKKLIISAFPFVLCVWPWAGLLSNFMIATSVVLGCIVFIALIGFWVYFVDKHFKD